VDKHAVGLRRPQRSVDEVIARAFSVTKREVSWQTSVTVKVDGDPRLLARVSDGLNQLHQHTVRKLTVYRNHRPLDRNKLETCHKTRIKCFQQPPGTTDRPRSTAVSA